jgi:hypothetical protein
MREHGPYQASGDRAATTPLDCRDANIRCDEQWTVNYSGTHTSAVVHYRDKRPPLVVPTKIGLRQEALDSHLQLFAARGVCGSEGRLVANARTIGGILLAPMLVAVLLTAGTGFTSAQTPAFEAVIDRAEFATDN